MAKSQTGQINAEMSGKFRRMAEGLLAEIEEKKLWGKYGLQIDAEAGKIRTIRRTIDETHRTGGEQLTEETR